MFGIVLEEKTPSYNRRNIVYTEEYLVAKPAGIVSPFL